MQAGRWSCFWGACAAAPTQWRSSTTPTSSPRATCEVFSLFIFMYNCSGLAAVLQRLLLEAVMKMMAVPGC